MTLFNALSRVVSDYAQGVVQDFQRFKNRDALEAFMASCALIAAADGYVSPEERRKVVAFIQSSPVFGVFDVDSAVILFNKYAAPFQADSRIAQANICHTLNRFKGDSEVRRTIIRLGAMLAEGPEEKAALHVVCAELGERPESFPELRDLGRPLVENVTQAMWSGGELPHHRRIDQIEREAEAHRRATSYQCVAPPSRPTAKTTFTEEDRKNFFGD